MTELQNLTVAQLRQVIAIKEQIESLEAQLSAITNGHSVSVGNGRRGPRRISMAARAAIAAAQRARWAKVRAEKGEVAPKQKRNMSAAGRARIAAAARARWAKFRADKAAKGK
jgi:hypothetical protein